MDGVVVAGSKPKNLQTFKQNSGGRGGGLKVDSLCAACGGFGEHFGPSRSNYYKMTLLQWLQVQTSSSLFREMAVPVVLHQFSHFTLFN